MKHLAYWLLTSGMLVNGATHAEVILSDISSAENSILTSSNRIFITGNKQVVEATQEAGLWVKKPVPAFLLNGDKATCDFLGITEMQSQGKIYTVCADNVINPISKKRVFSLDLTTASPELREIGEVKDATLINGLTDDENGNLYAADSAIAGPGKIIKLTPTSTGLKQSTLLQYLIAKPNGLKFDAGRVYATLDAVTLVGETQVVRYDLTATGLTNAKVIYKTFSFLDDLNLVKGGVVVADFITGWVRHVDENTGKVLHQAAFMSPSSVLVGKPPALPQGSLLVTEKLSNTVYKFDNNWGLEPR